jgi:hypothetical protein
LQHRELPRPAVTPPKRDVAPHAHTSATDVPTTPSVRTPISHTKYPMPITAPPQVPTERTPATIVHGPRDLSTLCSDTPNPWGTLRHCHYSRSPCDSSGLRSDTWGSLHHHHYSHYSHAPKCVHWKHNPSSIYPTNTYLHSNPAPKPPTPTPIWIFETVRHPHGIGPNKPVIRVPVWMEVATSTPPAPSNWAIAKSVHPTAPVQCHCGQLVPSSGNQVSHSFPLHHPFSSFISQFISLSFPFPKHLFSCFTFL